MAEDDGLLINFSSRKPNTSKTSQSVAFRKKNLATASTGTKKATVAKQAPVIKKPAAPVSTAAAAAPATTPATTAAAATATTTTTSESIPSSDLERTSLQQKFVHGRNQVVSSIFTANPEFRQPLAKNIKRKVNDIPSNAPVADSTTFTGLGIDPDLCTGLSSKLGVEVPTNVQRKAIPTLLGPSRTVRDATIPDHDVDVVVQAETGSGKTLTYLLPVVSRLVAASTITSDYAGFGDRAIGTVAIILTPTRELAQQVLQVLQKLVNVPRSQDVRRLHWIVPGLLIGGENKNKEKARLRKGVNVLVSTPGRLLDHLENTKSFDVRQLRWLILDEADRLLDLGFEETLTKIMKLLDERNGKTDPKYITALQHKFWPAKRQNVLCSATLRDDVKHLAGVALDRPVFVSGNAVKESLDTDQDKDDDDMMMEKYSTPNQLKQTYTITPAKLRLVTLTAMIRSCFWDAQRKRSKNSKVIVFLSCCDSVDFHYALFGNAGKQEDGDDNDDGEQDESDDGNENKAMHKALNKIMGNKKVNKPKTTTDDDDEPDLGYLVSQLLNDVPVYRLHGDMDQKSRTRSYQQFSQSSSGVLLCTDVAARGLDMPDVDRIIQYDPPTDLKDYVHRVGRTARLGKAGSAALFLLPSEMDYLDILKAQDLFPEPVTVEAVLSTLTPKVDFHTPAQELQNKMEQFLLHNQDNVLLARKAYWSSMRAYATHASAEKHIFHVRKLHLGHMAKSFALREAPSNLQETSKGQKKKEAKKERMPGKAHKKANPMKKRTFDHADEFAITSADSLPTGPTTRQRKKSKKT
ncbi:P-loop containing nucleoside triphosphate hydrolase protein [Zychaea mexicana]|uniref:P-loop containing nucleoside triphosphate hydrolase protein n=1 Tax=Zychaea mexicana TaxID=64656 RepID=UPI0022FDFED3|nr:P-loop containing nucleoside triphosphate hydrolase protein [Zychaea mexicana]KAI9498135.1 P-loop containing nucleoside triphosphate hydrolase protein [Zychaea mexicana]